MSIQSEFMVKECLADTTVTADDLIAIGDSANSNNNRHCKVSDFVVPSLIPVAMADNTTTFGADVATGTYVLTATTAKTVAGKLCVSSLAAESKLLLPTPSASLIGLTFLVGQTVDQTLKISTASGSYIMADGSAASSRVEFSTASHKIGACARVTCVSATKYFVNNVSVGCTMTTLG